MVRLASCAFDHADRISGTDLNLVIEHRQGADASLADALILMRKSHSDPFRAVTNGGLAMRRAGKTAIVVGAGQSPGESLGNGCAAALLLAREGAGVLAVDNNLASAEETAALIIKDGGSCTALAANVTREETLRVMVAEAMRLWKRIDFLQNNVGVSLTGGDAASLNITEAAFDRLSVINLQGIVMARGAPELRYRPSVARTARAERGTPGRLSAA